MNDVMRSNVTTSISPAAPGSIAEQPGLGSKLRCTNKNHWESGDCMPEVLYKPHADMFCHWWDHVPWRRVKQHRARQWNFSRQSPIELLNGRHLRFKFAHLRLSYISSRVQVRPSLRSKNPKHHPSVWRCSISQVFPRWNTSAASSESDVIGIGNYVFRIIMVSNGQCQ